MEEVGLRSTPEAEYVPHYGFDLVKGGQYSWVTDRNLSARVKDLFIYP